MLDEKKAYQHADQLITQNQQDEMIKLLSKYDTSYKNVGSLLGQNVVDGFKEKIQGAEQAFKDLTNQITNDAVYTNDDSDSNDSSSDNSDGSSNYNTSGSGDINVGDNVWIADAKTTDLYEDASHNNSDGTAWDNGIGSSDELKVVAYDNGFMELQDESGSDLGWVERTALNKWNDVARFYDGGRLGDLGLDGKFVKADSNEMIANANDTIKFDAIYDFVKANEVVLDQLVAQQSSVKMLNIPTVSTDLNNMANNIVNTNNTTNKQGDVSITNNFNMGTVTDTKQKSFATSITTQIKQDLRTWGVITK